MKKTNEPKPINLARVRTYPISERKNKVHIDDFASIPRPGAGVLDFLQSLPAMLKAREFENVIQAIVQARKNGKPLMWSMGAHVIKCGLNPWLITLMEKGVITSISTNGAATVHDFEIALIGETSEDVGQGLHEGTFGMARETSQLMNEALDRPEVRSGEMGMGKALGLKLLELDPPHVKTSILAAAASMGIPFTVHIALGTDITHMTGHAAGALLGESSFTDFRIFTGLVCRLSGGVYLNAGSAVIMPEVFLKAFTIAQNLGSGLRDFVTVNLDMLQQYRPSQNVVARPAAVGGRGYSIIGHHEIMIPLLGWAVIEAMEIT